MYQNKTPYEACLDHYYHVYLDDNNLMKLKDSSSWYIHIQGQMVVCKKKKQWCDFMLYTKKDIAVDRTQFDSELYEIIVLASTVSMKRKPTGLNDHLSIRDVTLTSCHQGS